METSLVIAVIGPDRPGLVEKLAETVAGHGGNWLDSRMAVLGGQFAGVVQATVPDEGAAALQGALAALEDDGLHVMIEGAPGEAPAGGFRRVRLEVAGQDHPGIVRDISRVLWRCGVNIAELETHRGIAAMSAEPIFTMEADVALPEGLGLDALRRDLEALAGDILVEIELAEAAGG